MTIYIDARPLVIDGEWAVWRLKDIPNGVRRGLAFYRNSAMALYWATKARSEAFICAHDEQDLDLDWMAAVAWDDLQPPIDSGAAWYVGQRVWWDPGGRYPPGARHGSPQWVMVMEIHQNRILRVAPETGEDGWVLCRSDMDLIFVGPPALPKPIPRGKDSMTVEQWGPYRNSDGRCNLCKADDSMWCDTVAHKQYAEWSARTLIDNMSASVGELICRKEFVSEHSRAAWSAALRAKVKASKERERNQVLVDRDFEDWE